MDLHGIHRFLQELFQSGGDRIAAFLMGVFLTAAIFYSFRHWFGRGAHELRQEKAKSAALAELLQTKDEKLHQITNERDDLKQRLDAGSQTLSKTQAELDETQKKLHIMAQRARSYLAEAKMHIADLRNQIDQVDALHGKAWLRPAGDTITPFRTLERKSPAIIAVTNLKGGVGKTSLTANIAYTLWNSGKRVLLVDLDYQGSLTNLCLPPKTLGDLRLGRGRFVQNVFTAEDGHANAAWSNLTPVGDQSYLLAANEALAEVEESLKARWLVNSERPDCRYILREALHASVFQERFDFILIDCPPRLTLAGINALTAADLLLVPVIPDRVSAEAVPRLLISLREFRDKGICPNLNILGVVGNRAYHRRKMIARERNVWEDLKKSCHDAWLEPVHLFKHVVPHSTVFAEAAANRKFAAEYDSLAPVFKDLVQEILRRKAHHEGSRPATVRA
ncbi:MAG: AAA family ATPase [Planctomycetes bacterium]|nr:AAA family ATPase [Planctomycetota bacterium]